MKDEIWKIANEIKDELISIRRQIHMHPELGYEEFETSKLVAEKLHELGIETRTKVAQTGVIGLIRGTAGEGKTIGIRADMDALALQEENDVPYKSKFAGKMHACGHDAHTAILIGVAKVLARIKDRIKGNVKLFFQPAEEGLGGARPMVEEGALENPPVSAAIALHVSDETAVGTVKFKDGSISASSDRFWIDLEVVGGHAASPHKTVDSIVMGSYLVSTLQSIASRNTNPVDPVVVSICIFNAGTAYNVIPETAHLEGTIRALSPEVRDATYESIKRITDGIAKTFGGKATCGIKRGYSPGFNDPELNKIMKEAATELLGEDKIAIRLKPMMGAEDFYEFSDNGRLPVAMFMLGIRNEEKGIVHPGHSSKFDIDEEAIPIGCAVLALAAVKYLEKSVD